MYVFPTLLKYDWHRKTAHSTLCIPYPRCKLKCTIENMSCVCTHETITSVKILNVCTPRKVFFYPLKFFPPVPPSLTFVPDITDQLSVVIDDIFCNFVHVKPYCMCVCMGMWHKLVHSLHMYAHVEGIVEIISSIFDVCSWEIYATQTLPWTNPGMVGLQARVADRVAPQRFQLLWVGRKKKEPEQWAQARVFSNAKGQGRKTDAVWAPWHPSNPHTGHLWQAGHGLLSSDIQMTGFFLETINYMHFSLIRGKIYLGKFESYSILRTCTIKMCLRTFILT